VIALIAVPILIQSYGMFALAYGAAYALKVPHKIAAPCALIGTSNFFELAVAVAISLFGLNSGAALATVVGVLVEVPVMLSLVAFANRTQGAFGRG
jgi:ACR3 family arsenite transporter